MEGHFILISIFPPKPGEINGDHRERFYQYISVMESRYIDG